MPNDEKLKLVDEILAMNPDAVSESDALYLGFQLHGIHAILTEWKELKHIFCEVVEISKGLPPMSEYNLKRRIRKTMNDTEIHLTFGSDQDADAFEKWLQMDGFAAFCAANNPNASATLVSNRHSGGITLTGADGPE